MAEEEIKLTTTNTTNGSTNDTTNNKYEFPETPQPEIIMEYFTSNRLNINGDKNKNNGN